MISNPRSVTDVDISACAALLAVAFFDDPVHSFIWPDPAARRRALPRFFDASLRFDHVLGGEVQMIDGSDGAAGVALWDPPGWRQPTSALVRSLPRLLPAVGRRVRAAADVRSALEATRPPGLHRHLNNIATAPDVRGTGYGRALMVAGIDACECDGVDAHLVCTRESTVPYYESFGFDVTEAVTVPRGGPKLWAMVRHR